MMLLYAKKIEAIEEGPHAEFEEPFAVPCRPWFKWIRRWREESYPEELKGTGCAGWAYRWHARRWWRTDNAQEGVRWQGTE
jgi:hypothetical protein